MVDGFTMIVPRSYRYLSPLPTDVYDEKRRNSAKNAQALSQMPPKSPTRSPSPARSVAEPVQTQPVAVPVVERGYARGSRTMPSRSRNGPSKTARRSAYHDPNALPPAVAALLAVTAIPPPRANQFRRKSREQRRVSIDELVSEWKNEGSLNSSFSSSPGLSILLEDADEHLEQRIPASADAVGNGMLRARSTSSESMPSLEADDRSVRSLDSPSTPASLRSRKSCGNLRKERMRSTPLTQDTTLNHPLAEISPADDDNDEGLLLSPTKRVSPPKSKMLFKSNLTTSLKALKKATMNSFASFTLNSATLPAQRPSSSSFSDEMLWSHPFLFPRLSSEVRPAIKGTPSQAQRRYLNPMPLTFEEQEAPFQRALHAPYLSEPIDNVPTIQMQTYTRGRRKASSKRAAAAPEPTSEAGRALLGSSGVRQREPRENSDFLRVVVLEMNMRREGKLESGRAKIWLPPRQANTPSKVSGKTPERWVGVSAY